MSKLFSRLRGFLSFRKPVGVDKAGNRYFTREEVIDGVKKEKRWVVFKGEEDSISIPVEWICWLNGQRRKAPTPQELIELEAKRERVKANIARLKKEEEAIKSKDDLPRGKSIGKVGGPDLKSFIQQFPDTLKGNQSDGKPDDIADEDRSTEPSGSGQSFKPGTWQPPT